MAFAVSIGSGYSTTTVRFSTAQEALAKARDEEEHGARGVTVRITASGETFTVEEFAAKVAEASPS